jgi:hypothetical protein
LVRVTETLPLAADLSAPCIATDGLGRIEILLTDGTVVRAGQDVGLATLRRLLAALRG